MGNFNFGNGKYGQHTQKLRVLRVGMCQRPCTN